jgi:transposase
MTGKRRRFTAEFKEESVRLVLSSGRPLAQVARELGIHENTLHKWKAAVGMGLDGGVVSGSGPLALAEENRRLQAELLRVKEERDILKKATAFFARESR